MNMRDVRRIWETHGYGAAEVWWEAKAPAFREIIATATAEERGACLQAAAKASADARREVHAHKYSAGVVVALIGAVNECARRVEKAIRSRSGGEKGGEQ